MRDAEDRDDRPHADLLRRLASANRTAQRAACEEAVALLGEDESFRAELQTLLREGDPRARFAAAWALFHGLRPSLRLLAPLLDALELEDGDLRWSATHLLVLLGRLHGEVLPVLLHEAREAPGAVRRRMALYAVRELAPEREDAHATFLAALSDSDVEVRRAALSSLAKLRGSGPECLQVALRIAREDRDPRMRRIAAVILPDLAAGHPGQHAEVLTLLESLREAGDDGLARAARAAAQRLG